MKVYLHILLIFSVAISLCISCETGTDIPASQTMEEGRQLSNPADTLVFMNGLQLFKQQEYNLARTYFLQSAESQNVYIRAESFLYLNALEMELENYDTARLYLERYHSEAMKLYTKAIEAENNIRNHKEEIDLSVMRLNKKHNRLVTGIITTAILAAALMLFLLHKQSSTLKAADKTKEQIRQNHHVSDTLSYKKYLISAEIFKQTPIYTQITELAKQKKDRDTKILNSAGQDVLSEKLDEIFSEFINELKSTYSLTDNDIKLCCLSLLPFSTFAKAICFGTIETNVIKQRKHQIKKKMIGHPNGTALFEFIFTERQNSI